MERRALLRLESETTEQVTGIFSLPQESDLHVPPEILVLETELDDPSVKAFGSLQPLIQLHLKLAGKGVSLNK